MNSVPLAILEKIINYGDVKDVCNTREATHNITPIPWHIVRDSIRHWLKWMKEPVPLEVEYDETTDEELNGVIDDALLYTEEKETKT